MKPHSGPLQIYIMRATALMPCFWKICLSASALNPAPLLNQMTRLSRQQLALNWKSHFEVQGQAVTSYLRLRLAGTSIFVLLAVAFSHTNKVNIVLSILSLGSFSLLHSTEQSSIANGVSRHP